MVIKRYLNREVIHTMFALIGILLIVVLSDMFVRFLSSAAEGNLSSDFIVALVGLTLPQYLLLLLPVAFFLSIVVTFGRMFSDNELSILFACGFGWKDFIKTLLAPTMIIMILVSVLAFYLVPMMTAYQIGVQQTANKKQSLSLIQPRRFLSFDHGNRVVYIGDVNNKQEYQEIFAFDRSIAKEGPSIITAPKAYLLSGEQAGEENIVLRNGYQYTGQPDQANFRVIHFDRYSTRLLQKKLILDRQRINSRSTTALLSHFDKQAAIEFEWRATVPVGVIVLMLLALAICKVKPRQGRYAKLLPAILIFIAYFNSGSALHAWMQKNNVLHWYLNLWWVHLVFGLVALYWLWKSDGCTWFRKVKP